MKPLETGAPANARLLETHAADAEREVVRIKAEIERQTALLPQADGSDEQTRRITQQLSALREQLNEAYDLWFKLSKQVREYDKAVDASRREGEKISRADVEEYLTQVWRFQRIARQAFIVGICQDAILCRDEQDFHQKYAQLINDTESNGLRQGIENEKFPAFVLECYERSL